jgi:hypothetical protein
MSDIERRDRRWKNIAYRAAITPAQLARIEA